MISALSALAGGSLAQPLQFSSLSFVIVSALELVVLRGFAEAKTRSRDVGVKL